MSPITLSALFTSQAWISAVPALYSILVLHNYSCPLLPTYSATTQYEYHCHA